MVKTVLNWGKDILERPDTGSRVKGHCYTTQGHSGARRGETSRVWSAYTRNAQFRGDCELNGCILEDNVGKSFHHYKVGEHKTPTVKESIVQLDYLKN